MTLSTGLCASWFLGISFVIVEVEAMAVAVEPRSMHHYARKHGAGMNMDIPLRPLQKSVVERWADLLNASEAQRRFMMVEYDRFVDRHNAFMDAEAPRYLELGREVAEIAREEGIRSRDFVDLAQKLDQANVRFRNRMIALENSYIDMFEPILTVEQTERVHLVRHEARRRNCRTFRSFMRWIDVELRDVWMRTAAELVSPEVTTEVEAILAEYEPQLTALVCRRADLHFRIRSQLRATRLAREEGAIPFGGALPRYRRILRGRLQADRAVRLLNERTLDEIASRLDADVRAALLDDAMQTAFPEVYPDRTQIHEFIARIADDEEIDDELRFIVSQWLDGYAAEHARLSDELENLCLEWGERNSEGASGYQIQFLPDALKPLLDERTDLSRRYLHHLHDFVGSETLARHADAVPSALRPELAELLEAADQTGN